MIDPNNTTITEQRGLSRQARMLIGILTLSACIFPAPASSQEDDAKDKASETENSTSTKPEMSLSNIKSQLMRYDCIQSDSGWKVIEHFKLVEDNLETVKDFPVIADVLWLCHDGPDALPRAKYVRSLIAMGADVNAPGTNGNAPLFQAVLGKDVECVRLLVDAGADVNCPGKMDMTPLMLACLLRKPEAVKVLLKAKAKINTKLPDGSTAMSILMDRELAVNGPEEDRLECINLLKKEQEKRKAKKAAKQAARAQHQ